MGRTGFDPSQAGNDREALDLLEAGETFDLVCIDWNIPVMGGLEFVAAVRARGAPDVRWSSRCIRSDR